MFLTKTLWKDDVENKIGFQNSDATSLSNYLIIFLFYSLPTHVFQLEENVSKSPEKGTLRDVGMCWFSITILF